MSDRQGKGELEYEDGTKKIGQWANHKKQGEFKCYDQSRTLTHTKIYENNTKNDSDSSDSSDSDSQ